MVPDCPRLGLWTLLPQSLWIVVVTSKALPGRKYATSARGLKSFALIVWRKIIPSYLKSLTETMQKHKKAVVDAQKSHRKYGKHLGIVFCMIYSKTMLLSYFVRILLLYIVSIMDWPSNRPHTKCFLKGCGCMKWHHERKTDFLYASSTFHHSFLTPF